MARKSSRPPQTPGPVRPAEDRFQPLAPFQALQAAEAAVPGFVFAAANDLIVASLCGGVARFSLRELREKVRSEYPVEIEAAGGRLHDRWFNIEDAYRRAGWEVDYEQPGFNEPGEATFTFLAPKQETKP